MATDYSILEQELIETKAKLQREIHMHNVRRLYKKQKVLAKTVIQRKQIETLTKETAELEATVSTLYCPQYTLKDQEIKGYLVYLLKMKDFFAREVATKEESINQLDLLIKMQLRKLCVITRELAKIVKNKPRHSPEFIRLENMSNRMEQMNKRICTMRLENKEIMENIIIMRKFQGQFKTFDRDFRRKINYLKGKGQDLLEKAVSSYEEKDECKARQRVYEERRFQDIRKTAITENALNLCLQRTEKNESFAKLQATLRIDNRIAAASDMIEEGVTGLEASTERTQDLQTAISTAAGEDTPDKMELSFKVASDSIDQTLSYLDELLNDMNRLQVDINSLKKENKDLTKNMSGCDRKLRMKIKLNQDEVQKKLEEANEASELAEEAKHELNPIFDVVKSLYVTCCPEDSLTLEKLPIDDTNIIDYLQKMEDKILDYLICHEYNLMKEASDESKPVLLDAEEDEDIEDESEKIEDINVLKPRTLQSENELQSLMELGSETSFLEFKALKERAVAVIAEVESEKSEDEIDN